MPVAQINLFAAERDRPAPLSAIRLYLESRHYPAWAIDHAVEHIERHGTADVGPSFLLDDEREHVATLAAAYRSTIRQAAWEDAHAAIFPDPTFPQKRWESAVARTLWDRGYCPPSIRVALAHVAIFGRAAGCRDLDGPDAEAVDAILTAKGGRR